MIINAKFTSQCPACGGAIDIGERVEWTKGARARHVVCQQSASAQTISTATSTPRRGWRPCGYPGCSPQYCDECDGEGLVLGYRRSGGRS